MSTQREVEDRIFKVIFEFPERIDEMETRNEENCRLLAVRIAALLKDDLRPREGRRQG